MRPATILSGLALILSVVSAVAVVPLWIPLALLSVAVLMMQGAIRI
jgi:hypothetical protein